MSTITNDPIMLNETGLLIKDALDRQNGYLAMLAEGKRSENLQLHGADRSSGAHQQLG